MDDTNPAVAIFWIFAALIYFAPSIVASRREHRQQGAIFVLNLFLGWTLIGWVVALVWSNTHQEPKAPPSGGEPGSAPTERPSTVQELERLAALRASGAIDDAEFADLKAKILSQ